MKCFKCYGEKFYKCHHCKRNMTETSVFLRSTGRLICISCEEELYKSDEEEPNLELVFRTCEACGRGTLSCIEEKDYYV